MNVLGIETSCDETAAAVVEDGGRLLSCVVASSADLHAQYGGVVPEIAARSHIESITPVIKQALEDASLTWNDIDAIAVTYGAGLGGSLLIGVLTARSLAIAYGKPLYAVNHVEGHVYANFLTETAPSLATAYKLPATAPLFPMLALIVSGGHSQLVLFRDHFDYTLLGQTHDDAIGEAFDKVAKILGLPYPGGPSVGTKALEGNPFKHELPKAHMGKYDFSFSGLKTAVLRLAQAEIGEDFTFPSKDLPGRLYEGQKADIAASFQRVAIETVVDKTITAYEEFQPRSVVIAGGVAASPELRRQLKDRLSMLAPPVQDVRSDALQGGGEQRTDPYTRYGKGAAEAPTPQSAESANGMASSAGQQVGGAHVLHYTDPKLCTDNGAMIAALGCFKAMRGQPAADPYTLDIDPSLSM